MSGPGRALPALASDGAASLGVKSRSPSRHAPDPRLPQLTSHGDGQLASDAPENLAYTDYGTCLQMPGTFLSGVNNRA